MPGKKRSPMEPAESDANWPFAEESAGIIAEAASDAIITIGEDGKILFANSAVEEIFGYSVSEMLGQELTMVMPESLRQLHCTGLNQYLRTGIKRISWKAFEVPGMHRSGQEICLEISFAESAYNGKRFFTGVARDITQRKRDEQRLALQISVTRILAESTSLMEAAPRLVETICLNRSWRFGELWTLNSQKTELQFVASANLPSADVSEFEKAGQMTTFRPGIGIPGQIWATKAPVWVDRMPTSKNFPRTDVALCSGLNAAFGFPLLLDEEIVGVIAFFSNEILPPTPALLDMMETIGSQIGQFIERKNAEEEVARILLREHEARLQAEALTRRLSALQRVTDAALATFSLNNLLTELLARVREVLHVDTAAILLLESGATELTAWAALGLESPVEQKVRVPVGKGFAGRIIDEGKPRIIENVTEADIYSPLLKEKGICSLLGVPLLVEGRAVGVIHVGTLQLSRFTDDDTRLLQLVADRIALAIENARLYETEREARSAAEKANILKDEFLTILSHELRTPLTPILGWSHMIHDGLLAESDLGQAVSVIRKNAQTLKRLIDDLLDMSAVMSDKMQINRLPVSLAHVLRDSVDAVSTQASDAGVELRLVTSPESLVIMGDSDRLVQIFGNLLHNAIKFTPPGGTVEINARVVGENVSVSIKDTGQGIESEFLPHVFERFRQADGSRSRTHGGLGLGLALVKSLVDGHGGSVSAASDGKGKGATFRVELPLEFKATPAHVNPDEPEPLKEKRKVRVLVVEDQPDTLEMLSATFATQGLQTTLCQSASEAIEAAERLQFDIIVSDIAMREMDGFELIRRLRRNGALRSVPAIALTGYASDKDAEAALSAGFDVHLRKPVDPAELTLTIERLLRSRARKSVVS